MIISGVLAIPDEGLVLFIADFALCEGEIRIFEFEGGLSPVVFFTDFAFHKGSPAGSLDVVEAGLRTFHFLFDVVDVFLVQRFDFIIQSL